MARRYTDAEVDAILSAALEEQPGEGIAHDDLIAAAAEIGLPADAVERAAAKLEREQEEEDVVIVTREARAKRKARFISHLSTFVLVTAFLFAVNMLSGGGLWAHWVLLSWGLVVALQGSKLLQEEPVPKKALKARRKARKKEAEKREAAKRKAEKKPDEGSARVRAAVLALDAAVKARAAGVLEALAERVKDPEPLGAFGQYVAEQKGERSGTRDVRVAALEEAVNEADEATELASSESTTERQAER